MHSSRPSPVELPVPAGVAYAFTTEQAVAVLHPAERLLIEHLSHNIGYLKNFSQGRACAHTALSQLRPDVTGPILRDPEGRPIWPQGITGSIAHCPGAALAAVTHRSQFASIGVDIEPLTRKLSERAKATFDLPELASLNFEASAALTSLCMKEALFKAASSASISIPEFRAISFSKVHTPQRDVVEAEYASESRTFTLTACAKDGFLFAIAYLRLSS